MKRKSGRRMARGFCLIILVTAVSITCIGNSDAAADSLKCKVKNKNVKLEWVPVGDQPGHILGVNRREGEAVFEDGQTAIFTSASNFEFWTGKGGPFIGYTKLAFDDGSTMIMETRSDTKPDQENRNTVKTQGKITAGSGRFDGIQGTYLFVGKQLKPSAEDPGREVAGEATIEYTLKK